MSREQLRAMDVIEIPKGSTGSVLVLTLKRDGVAPDFSAASGVQYSAKTLSGAAVATDVAASWYTDGTDGKVAITLTSALAGTVRSLMFHVELTGFNGGSVKTFANILRVAPDGEGV